MRMRGFLSLGYTWQYLEIFLAFTTLSWGAKASRREKVNKYPTMYKMAPTADRYPVWKVNSEGREPLGSSNWKYTCTGALRLACLLDTVTNPLCPKRQWPSSTREDLRSNETARSWCADGSATFCQRVAAGLSARPTEMFQGLLSPGHEKVVWRTQSFTHQLCLLCSTSAVAVSRPGKATRVTSQLCTLLFTLSGAVTPDQARTCLIEGCDVHPALPSPLGPPSSTMPSTETTYDHSVQGITD